MEKWHPWGWSPGALQGLKVKKRWKNLNLQVVDTLLCTFILSLENSAEWFIKSNIHLKNDCSGAYGRVYLGITLVILGRWLLSQPCITDFIPRNKQGDLIIFSRRVGFLYYTVGTFWYSILYVSQSVQSLSHVRLFATPWTAAHQASLSIKQGLFKLTSIDLVMPSNQFILCRRLLLPPSIFPSIRVFSNESALHIRCPLKYWSFSINISPSNEYSGLISFRMDWLDLLAVQGTLKSLLQHHHSKASIL